MERDKRTYSTWANILQYCQNPRDKCYSRYGGRGIKVCSSWKQYANFLADMGIRPAGMRLVRKNEDQDFTPGNCQWKSVSARVELKRVKIDAWECECGHAWKRDAKYPKRCPGCRKQTRPLEI